MASSRIDHEVPMLDVILDLVLSALADGVPSPDTLDNQRKARLVVSVIALIVNLAIGLLFGESALRGWPLLVLLGMTFAAGWALIFSVVDLVKELPSVPWWSVAVIAVAASSIAVVLTLAFGEIPTRV
jgi:hypothetical protein